MLDFCLRRCGSASPCDNEPGHLSDERLLLCTDIAVFAHRGCPAQGTCPGIAIGRVSRDAADRGLEQDTGPDGVIFLAQGIDSMSRTAHYRGRPVHSPHRAHRSVEGGRDPADFTAIRAAW